MSSPIRVLGPVSTSRAANSQKRILTDSEDVEERDAKRARSQDGTRRDSKEKKKRRRKKRRVSVVQDSSGTDTPTLASQSELARVRSVASPLPDAVVVAPSIKIAQSDARQPSAGPSVSPDANLSLPRAPTRSESTEKGKARASLVAVGVQEDSQEVTELQNQVTDKTNLVSRHENLVSSLQQSLSCQICLDLMHKPYALSPCGHSACYQCLVNWFTTPPPDAPENDVAPAFYRKKTCPHCRAVVTERPVEIWTIKEMVASLVKSGLATGFFSNTQAQPEEGQVNTDPWADIFRRPTQHRQDIFPDVRHGVHIDDLQRMGMRDDEDDVYRCVDCHYEIVDGACVNCGRDYDGHDLYDSDSESDDFPAWGGHGPLGLGALLLQHLYQQEQAYPRDYGIDFFDPAVDVDAEISDDYDDDEIDPRDIIIPPQRRIVDSDTDEEGYESSFIDDDDAEPMPRPRNRRRGRAVDLDENRIIELSDGESQDGLHDDEEGEHEEEQPARHVSMLRRHHAPMLRPLSDEEEGDDDLAAEVAAHELELYGDDGSVPRRVDHEGYDSLDSDEDYY